MATEQLVGSHDELEQMARALECSGDYHVLRRLPSDLGLEPIGDPLPHIGIVLDTETTGLDVEIDEVIELGMVKFRFSSDGRIGPIIGRFQAFQEPQAPVSDEIARLTGLSAAELSGHVIDANAVSTFVEGSAIVVAHNAGFDRPFSERLSACFAGLPWACSATEIDWRAEGIMGYRLEYLLSQFGYFHDAHRAIADCEALLFILSQQLPVSSNTGFAMLLDAARRPVARIFAEGAPFDARHALKRVGYRWNDGQNGFPRAWWRDVDPNRVDEELAFLASQDVQSRPLIFRMTARDRFRAMARV